MLGVEIALRGRIHEQVAGAAHPAEGFARIERVVLYTLHEAQRELGDRNVPTAMLYGRVVERVDISVDELQRVLQRLIGVR